MVTEGKSGRSWSSTSPMLSRTRPEAALAPVIPLTAGSLRGGRRTVRGLVALEENQAVLADLHLVGVLQDHGVDAIAVHVRAVQAAGVRDAEGRALACERGVPPGDGDVVEEDLAVGVP